MNIDDIKYGYLKKIAAIFNAQPAEDHPFIGKYVICRCEGAGSGDGEGSGCG